MRVYFDASLIVAMLTDDPRTERVELFLRSDLPLPVVSDFASAEASSAVARRVRTREMTSDRARAIFASLDAWFGRNIERVETTTTDVRRAESFVRRLDLGLRTPDALNLAIAQRVGAALGTFDEQLAAAARALGTVVVPA